MRVPIGPSFASFSCRIHFHANGRHGHESWMWSPESVAKEALIQRDSGRLGTGGDTQLPEDVGDMDAGR